METNRTVDMKNEAVIRDFTMHNLYGRLAGEWTYESVNDEESQLAGIDVIARKSGEGVDIAVNIDQKAAMNWSTVKLKTYCFEVSYLNKAGVESVGWLIRNGLKTDLYDLAYPHVYNRIEDMKEGTLRRPREISEKDVLMVQCNIVPKASVLKLLKDHGYTKERLWEIAQAVRAGKAEELGIPTKKEDGDIYFKMSEYLAEKPVNVVIRFGLLSSIISAQYSVVPGGYVKTDPLRSIREALKEKNNG